MYLTTFPASGRCRRPASHDALTRMLLARDDARPCGDTGVMVGST